jgi:hypothetical protein
MDYLHEIYYAYCTDPEYHESPDVRDASANFYRISQLLMSRKDFLTLEEAFNDYGSAYEEQGFIAGFGVAMRIKLECELTKPYRAKERDAV